tara:strand:- start:588 stop:2177 length:1590 start_codon:yes stop_codon:yes gene_type:complete
MKNELNKFIFNEKIYYFLLICFGLLVSFYYFSVYDQTTINQALIRSDEIYYKDKFNFQYLDAKNSWSLIFNLIIFLRKLNISLDFISFFILLLPLYMSLFGLFLISKILSDNVIFSFFVSCIIVIGNIHFGNLDYPVNIISRDSGSMIGTACALLVFGLIADKKLSLAILFSILLFGIHLVIGAWVLSVLVLSIYLFGKKKLFINFLTKKNIILIILTSSIIVLSFLESYLNKVNVPWSNNEYLYQVYLDEWDHHRSKIFGINYIYILLSFTMLVVLFFFFKKEDKKKEHFFFFNTLALHVLFSFIIYITYKIFPSFYQGIFLKVIPSRFFLIHSVFGVAIISSIIFFYLKPFLKNTKIQIAIFLILFLHPLFYLDRYTNKFERIYKNLASVKREYDQKFWNEIKDLDISNGLILSSVHSCSKTLRIAKKPILICMESIDGIPYMNGLIKPVKDIIENIYEVDYFNPPIKNYGGFNSDNIYKKTFENRSAEDWSIIFKDFNLKGLILPNDWNLQLNKFLIGKKYAYYKL